MGCCTSSEIGSEEAIHKLRDQEIDELLKKDRQKMSNEIKLLLLGNVICLLNNGSINWYTTGAGETGKSTLLKQMRIIHEGGFSQEEKLSCREIVFSNMIESMKSIVNAMHAFAIELSDQERNQVAFDLIDRLPDQTGCQHTLADNIAQAIKVLWQDNGIRACYQRKSEFQLNDSAA
jgi:guanine nucleotide-binding protein subunit alpha